MTDTPLHELYNNFNSKKRTDIKDALHGTVSVNNRLLEKHIISEPESTREEINSNVFDVLTNIENIIAQRDICMYLQQNYVSKTAELQQLKNSVKEAAKANKDDEIVNDIIGG